MGTLNGCNALTTSRIIAGSAEGMASTTSCSFSVVRIFARSFLVPRTSTPWIRRPTIFGLSSIKPTG